MPRLAPALALWLAAPALAGTPDAEDALFNKPDWAVAVRLHSEIGFLAPLSHTVQFGENGTRFDVINDLGQSTLYPVLRFSADLDLGKLRRNTITFLYQPLQLDSTGVARQDVVVDDLTFPATTPIEFNYGFSFFRLSWMYDTLKDLDKELAVGLSLQIRNARIGFQSEDGSLFRERRDVGPVPVLKLRGRGTVKGIFWMGGELDWFYANLPFINGGTTPVEGWIVDGSLRFGISLKKGIDPFLNVRYLGGGALGTDQSPEFYSDGFTANTLHFLTVSLGVTLR